MAAEQKLVEVVALWLKDGGIDLGPIGVKTSLQTEPTPTPGLRKLEMHKAPGEVVVSFDDAAGKRQVHCVPTGHVRSYRVKA